MIVGCIENSLMYLADDIFETFDEINNIDNKISKRKEIRNAIKAGANCMLRKT